MGSKLLKVEAALRLSSLVLASMAALLLGLDSQTENVLFKDRKATSKLLSSLWALMIIASVTAGYQLLQLCGHICRVHWTNGCDTGVGDCCVRRGAHAVVKALQYIYKVLRADRWGLLCCLLASLALAVMSSLSAYHLFQLYPSGPAIRKPLVGPAMRDREIAGTYNY